MKTALITGAARGIGLATTERFLADGWAVALLDRDKEELEKASSQLLGRGSPILPVIADVSDRAQVDTVLPTVLRRFGRLDALINNAGVADFGPIEQTDFARWRRVMEVRLLRRNQVRALA